MTARMLDNAEDAPPGAQRSVRACSSGWNSSLRYTTSAATTRSGAAHFGSSSAARVTPHVSSRAVAAPPAAAMRAAFLAMFCLTSSCTAHSRGRLACLHPPAAPALCVSSLEGRASWQNLCCMREGPHQGTRKIGQQDVSAAGRETEAYQAAAAAQLQNSHTLGGRLHGSAWKHFTEHVTTCH